jgi:hypothetical protein
MTPAQQEGAVGGGGSFEPRGAYRWKKIESMILPKDSAIDPLQHQKLLRGVLQWCQLSSLVFPDPRGRR